MNKMIYKTVFIGILCANLGTTTLSGQAITSDTAGTAYATIQIAEVVAMFMLLVEIKRKKGNKY